MIQIYSPDNTDFDKNGNMVLWPSEATVHVVLNSTWEASLFQPLDEDGRWKYIENNAVVKLPSFNGEQLFRIYDTDKDESGVTAKMYPIFYDAANEVFFTSVHPTDKDGQGALDVLCEGTKYSGSSDIDTVETAYYEYVNLIEALNGSIDQAFTSRWGGEILFDNYEVTINSEVGEDRGYSLTYGRNIPANGLSIETDMSDVVTRIYPQAYNGRALSGDGYVDSDLIGNYPTIRSKAITYDYIRLADDVSEDEEDSEDILICEDEDELDAALIAACEDEFADGIDKPSVTITADIVALEGTEQYQEFSGLAELSLGDTVTVYHSVLGIDTSVRVTELTYDCISETVTDITLGDFKSDYFDQTATKVANLTSAVETAREAAAAALAAANDATLLSVILSSEYQGVPVDDDGEYEELPDISTTVQVFYSNEDVTSKCDLDQSPSGLTGEWEDATYTVTEVTEDNAYVNLLISYGTLSVTKKFTVSKVYSGTEGPAGEDGKTSYFHIKYSEVESPTLSSEMTEEPSTYIGTYVDFEEADSNDPSDYTWSRFEGAQGEQGEQGIAGTNGEDGQTSYLHIAYANSEDGTEDFSVSDSEDKSYIGQYVDFEEDDSTDPEDYSWTLIKGEDGSSVYVVSAEVSYQVSDSATETPTGTWLSEIPEVESGKFLWTKTEVVYSDGEYTEAYSVTYFPADGTDGADGSDGVGVESITEYYLRSSSSSGITTSTSGWSTTIPTITSTYKYLWNYEVIAYTDGNSTSTDPAVIGVYGDTGSTGATGAAGADGADGVGISSITEYYARSTSNSTAPTSWSESVPTLTSTYKYLWNYEVITYTDASSDETDKRVIGVYGDTGATGASGADGSDGVGISSITEYYARSSSNSTTPSSWSTSVPTLTSTYKYLWNYETITYTDDSTTSTTAHVVGAYGDTGESGADGADGADGASFAWNLLEGTQDWSGGGASNGTVSDETYNGCSIFTATKTQTTSNTDYGKWSDVVEDPGSGEDYTLSFWAKADEELSIRSFFYPSTVASGVNSCGNTTTGSDGNIISTLTTEWERYWITWTTLESPDESPNIIVARMLASVTGTIYLAGVKLEQASIASEWAPAYSEIYGETGVGIESITEYYAVSTSNSTSPSSWSTTPPTMTSTNKYLWNYETVTYTDSTTTSTDPAVIGVYGDTGDDGESISISSKSVTYQSSSSGTTTPTGTWSSSVPSVSQGKFLWTKTVVTYSDGTSTTSYSVSYIAVDGTDGTSVTISGTEITYQLSSSGTTVPTGTWSESVPSLSQGKYLWTKTEVTYTDGTVTTSYSVSYLAVDGDDGEDGVTLYATCSTAAGTTTKVATITPTNSDFALSTGVTINITFTYKNTASSPKLNVNSTGAKSIYAFGSALAEVYYWSAGSTVQFVYNGSQWVMTDNAAMTIAANWCYENDTTYIDGANIYAGTLAANSIIAGDTLTNALTATNLTVTGDSTFEGTITGSTITGSDIYTSGTSTSGTVTADDRWAHLYNGTIEFGHFEDDDSEVTDGYITGADGGSIGMVGESELVLECPIITIRTTADLNDGCGVYIDEGGNYVYGESYFYDRMYLKKDSGDCFFQAKRADTGYGVQLGVGSGGYNRGVYDVTGSRWLAYADSSNVSYLQAKDGLYMITNEGNLKWRYIDCGTVSVGGTANSVCSATVTFNVTFDSTPYVFLTPITTVPGSQFIECGVSSRTTTGCTVYAYRSSTTSTSIHWMAVGYVT